VKVTDAISLGVLGLLLVGLPAATVGFLTASF
jgi:hypothetical protein